MYTYVNHCQYYIYHYTEKSYSKTSASENLEDEDSSGVKKKKKKKKDKVVE